MSTIDTITGREPQGRSAASLLVALGKSVMAAILWWERLAERRRTRLDLLELTDDQLKDIGLSRADAFREARRLYWFL